MDARPRPGSERLSKGRKRRRQAIVARADSGARGPRPGSCVAMALPTGAASRIRRARDGDACALRRQRGRRLRVAGAAAAGRAGRGAAAAGGPVPAAGLADRVAGAAAGPAGTCRLVGRLAVGAGADSGAVRRVLPGRSSLSAAGPVVDVGAEPHPVVPVAGHGRDEPERPGQRHHHLHRRDDRRGQRRLPAARPALPGRPDRAHRGGAGAAGCAGGAHPDRAGTARRGRPPYVADRGPGGDRAVPPQRPARIGTGRVQLAQRGGPRGADGHAAAARRAAPGPARRSRAAAPARGPARARRCRPAGRGIGRAVRTFRARSGTFPRRAVRVPDCAGIAVQRQPARPRSRRHRVGGPGLRRGPAARGQRARRALRPVPERARPRSRAGRDARAGGAARRLAGGRPGARWRLRGLRGTSAKRDGMTADGAASDVTVRCLIADDQAMVREGFAAVLAAQPGLQVVGQAADGADAVRQAQHLHPDVVLMDVRMPVMDGLEATRQILRAAAGPQRPRVLMLTTFDLDDYVYQALRAGASGFLLKDATAAELVHAVRVVAAGDALLAPSVTRRLIADFARQPRPGPAFQPTLGALTQRETEVLRLIAHGLSNTEISNTLVIAEQTTKTHVGRILAKLGLRDRAQAVVLAYETGLVTPGGSMSARANPDG